MTMTISDLPIDLQSEILCRVPLRSIKKVRLTCKKWDTLSKSEIFRKMHMSNEAAREQGESRMVTLMNSKLHLISVFVDDVNHPYTESKGILNLDDPDQQEQVKIRQVFHCEGLLLCVLEDTYRLVVWNPYLCQRRWIEPPRYCKYWPHNRWMNKDMYIYALGYDHNKKSHKILRLRDYLHERRHQDLRYAIYDFESNLWKALDVSLLMQCVGVPLKGNTYWLSNNDDKDHLVCFDFTSERFGPLLPLPLPEEEERQVYVDLSCLKEEKLIVLLQFEQPLEFEIWVTTMIDPKNVSWSKYLKINTGPVVLDPPYAIPYLSAGLFIDEEKKVAMGFGKGSSDSRYSFYIIGDDGFFRQVDILYIDRVRYPLDYARMCSCYVPSLVQLEKPPLRVHKRKQRSKLDKRPCEQYKSSRLDEKGLAKRTRRT